ncbi:MAG: SLATT domain-containing protein [Anaerolineales bacterium]
MSTDSKIPILEIAWTRYAQFDRASVQRMRPNLSLRRWILVLSVLATLLAILSEVLSDSLPAAGSLALKIALIATPIVGSGLAAFTKQFFGRGDHLVLRAGAEEILKEIYTYRTILKNNPNRREWLEKRLADIQRQVYRGLGGEMVFEKTPAKIPPYYDPKNPDSDPGFDDLNGDQYFRYRLRHQLRWHRDRLSPINRQRILLQVLIILTGMVSAFLAAMGGPFALWVALSASVAAALTTWQEVRNQDFIVRNYSKVVVELGLLHDHWLSLEPEEHTEGEFFSMVQATEEILWSQHVEYIQSMQEALTKLDLDEEAGLVLETVRQARAADARRKRQSRQAAATAAAEAFEKAEQAAVETFQTTLSTLAREASSEVVRQELQAMAAAAGEAIQNLTGGTSRLRTALDQIAGRYAHLKIDRTTPREVVNEIMAQFPPTSEVKG